MSLFSSASRLKSRLKTKLDLHKRQRPYSNNQPTYLLPNLVLFRLQLREEGPAGFHFKEPSPLKVLHPKSKPKKPDLTQLQLTLCVSLSVQVQVQVQPVLGGHGTVTKTPHTNTRLFYHSFPSIVSLLKSRRISNNNFFTPAILRLA